MSEYSSDRGGRWRRTAVASSGGGGGSLAAAVVLAAGSAVVSAAGARAAPSPARTRRKSITRMCTCCAALCRNAARSCRAASRRFRPRSSANSRRRSSARASLPCSPMSISAAADKRQRTAERRWRSLLLHADYAAMQAAFLPAALARRFSVSGLQPCRHDFRFMLAYMAAVPLFIAGLGAGVISGTIASITGRRLDLLHPGRSISPCFMPLRLACRFRC